MQYGVVAAHGTIKPAGEYAPPRPAAMAHVLLHGAQGSIPKGFDDAPDIADCTYIARFFYLV